MAKYFRYFETQAEFESAYTGEEYVEPFVAYIEENQGVAFSKPQLIKIEMVGLAMENDVPATGKTVDKDDCEYTVLAFYDDYTKKDITEEATVTGSLVVGASQIEERHSAGTLTLTAAYEEFEASKSIVVFQEAFVPTLTAITLDDLTWVEDIPASGGTATKDNCSYTVTAYYDNGDEVDVTDEVVVTGTLVVEESELDERHSAGTITLTATYSGFNDSDSVTVWQEAAVSYLTFDILSGGNIAFGCFPFDESGISLTIEYKVNNGEWTSLTSQLPVPPENTEGEENELPEDVVNAFPSKFSVNAGDVVQFRGNNAAYSILSGESGDEYLYCVNMFFSNDWFDVKGNIMSLVDKVNFRTLTTLASSNTFSYLFAGCYNMVSAEDLILPAITLTEWCYFSMFYNMLYDEIGVEVEMKLSSAPELPATTLAEGCYSGMFFGCTSLTTAPSILPATTLAEGCYEYMFGGCESLITAPELPATTLAGGCYYSMFYECTSLTSAPELPATTLANYCYQSMFQDCTSLTEAPELPATTLAVGCYDYMFGGCTGLTTAPELPATTLANYCYESMFNECTSLTTAPELPATTLAEYCYVYMFNGCTSLTTAPELPATTLAEGCYQNMFQGCTGLTTAPELPATTLAEGCYGYMFNGCTNLNYIKCLATNISAMNCTSFWVSGVASSGTFIKNPNMTGWTTGNDGIPSGWTVQDAS